MSKENNSQRTTAPLYKREVFFIISSCLLLIAGCYTFYWRGYEKSGLYVADEGFYVQAIKTHFFSARYLKDVLLHHAPLGGIKDYLNVYGGPFSYLGREGYILIVSVLSLFFLNNFSFYHGIMWPVIFGIASVIVLYLFTLKNFGSLSALISALLFMFSPIHVAHSRSGLSVSTALFFFLTGLYFYYKSFLNNKFMKYSAFLLAVSFTCHYNMFWVYIVVMAAEILYFKPKEFFRLFNFNLYFFLPIFIVEIYTLAVQFILNSQPYFKSLISSGHYGFIDYFYDLYLLFKDNNAYSEVPQPDFFYYFRLISQQHSLIFLVLVFSSLFLLIKKNRASFDRKITPLFLILVPFIYYSVIPNKADRMLVPFMAVFSLIIGLTFVLIRNTFIKICFSILISIVLLFEINMSFKALHYAFDIQEALNYMSDRQGKKHISSRMYVSQAFGGKECALDDFFYLGETSTGEEGKAVISLNNLQRLYADGWKYYVWFYPDAHQLAALSKNIVPEKTFKKYYNTEGHFCRMPNVSSDFPIEALRIYDVKKIIDFIKEGKESSHYE